MTTTMSREPMIAQEPIMTQAPIITGPEIMSAAQLAQKTVLVNLHIKSWRGSMTDRDVSNNVADQAGAARSVGRYIKRLMPTHAFKDLKQCESDARNLFHTMTSTWDEHGARILPTARFQEFDTRMKTIFTRYENSRVEFLTNYASNIEAAKVLQGKLFRASDYPHVEQLRFEMKCDTWATPDGSRITANLDAETANMLAEKIRQQMQARIANSVQENIMRIYTIARRVNEKVGLDDEGNARIFRDSTLANLPRELENVEYLNFAEDATVTQACLEIRAAIDGVEPDQLRPNKKAFDRDKYEHFAGTFSDLSTRFAAYFGDSP